MIWNDPWIALATDKSDLRSGPWCTTLPPPVPVLPAGTTFRCQRWSEIDAAAWIALVNTRWSAEALQQRLADAWIPCLYTDETLVGTCVLRPPRPDNDRPWWILETLRAQKGYGTLLMRSTMTWIYKHKDGPFALAYTWELTGAQLIGAWWQGWLQSMVALEYGWSATTGLAPDGVMTVGAVTTRHEEGCGWCPSKQTISAIPPRFAMPTVFRFGESLAVVSDSGLGDGWGYVSAVRGTPEWSTIAARGGWKRLWMRSAVAPPGAWSWTGEFVVVGLLNWNEPTQNLSWTTAEIAFTA
jgi:hypothetical protein